MEHSHSLAFWGFVVKEITAQLRSQGAAAGAPALPRGPGQVGVTADLAWLSPHRQGTLIT